MSIQREQNITIGLVVIGKNASRSLYKIYNPAYCDNLKQFFSELIYVDSSSIDNSVEIMLQAGFRVLSIENPNGSLTASAGRWAGTKVINSDYVLFLDSDMLFTEFDALVKRINEIDANASIAGLTGDTIDYYPGGSQRKRISRVGTGEASCYFGGYVLLKRTILEEVGNWSPELPVNEELDLNARLWKRGYWIVYFDDLPVQHHTHVTSPLAELLAIYLPFKKDRYGAYGYSLRAAMKYRTVWQLFYLAPEPVLFAILLLSSIVLFNLRYVYGIYAMIILYEIILLKRRSYRYNVVVPGLLLTIPVGLFRYKNASVKIMEVNY